MSRFFFSREKSGKSWELRPVWILQGKLQVPILVRDGYHPVEFAATACPLFSTQLSINCTVVFASDIFLLVFATAVRLRRSQCTTDSTPAFTCVYRSTSYFARSMLPTVFATAVRLPFLMQQLINPRLPIDLHFPPSVLPFCQR